MNEPRVNSESFLFWVVKLRVRFDDEKRISERH